jgi:hypothetical protein
MLGWFSADAARALSAETFQGQRISCNVFGQELECDEAIKISILSFIHNAHTTTPQLFEDPVVGDSRAKHARDTLRDLTDRTGHAPTSQCIRLLLNPGTVSIIEDRYPLDLTRSNPELVVRRGVI